MSTLMNQITRPRPVFFDPGFSTTKLFKAAGPASTHSGAQAFLAMPFDALRFQYAGAVMSGLVPRSMLASAKSERALDLLEKLILGPLARQR